MRRTCNPRYSGGEHFEGRLDDAAFYATALSSERIREIYEGDE